ncbi:TPA: hypothetical protein O4G69_003569 [Vibrio alginolyticus]|uniref:DUF6414 family protein n=1 Tax=Vibrio TaxID=662 RepID=UPI0004064359|nr:MULTISPECIES: hypothetical protein [Vibrio]EJS2607806.1 hypothetical protein [Vibrio alginolyticus]MDW3165392.1 hypothetical protein [Vibrio sp. Y184]HCZ9267003.1 hypothetical protein [Vibrio alginolyticus]
MIKNFLYLNESKLYSFSSQLFEGITEYVLNEQNYSISDEEKQQGKLFSGRVIADVIKETSSSTTKKFLHDHSFNLFESELEQSKRLLDVGLETLTFDDICKTDKSFIRIRAKGKFVDMAEIQTLFSNYAKIGEAIAVLPLTEQLQTLEKLKAQNNKSKETRELQSNLDKLIKERTVEMTSGIPPRAIAGFETIIGNFGDDIVRFQQQVNDVIFSTCLTHDYLREPLKNIYRKYSRKTAKEFTVLGFISHADGTQDPDVEDIPESENMLRHMIGLAENMYELEQTFGKKGDNEIIIEPIAIYTEL